MTSAVTPDPIDCAALGALAVNDSSGATVTFTGAVRNHDHGREVVGIEYVGHPSASQVLDEVVASFSERAGVQAVVAQHRTGLLAVGDVAFFVAVSASHRRQAFDTASALVDRVKEVLPVWKRQIFPDGSHEWTACP